MEPKILKETRLIALLIANAESTNENLLTIRMELSGAYDEFSEMLVRLTENENSIADMLHSLYYMRVELHALQQVECYKAKKKCALLSVS